MGQLMKSGNNLFKVGNNVFRYNSQCVFGSALSPVSTAQGSFSNCLGIAIDYPSAAFPLGRIFISNSSTVSILNYINPYAGSPTVITAAQGSFSGPVGIAIDLPSTAFSSGRIFVTNSGNGTVSVLNYSNPTAGSPTVITATQGTFNTPYGIAIDLPTTASPLGRIFVTNLGNSTVSILNYTSPTTGSPTIVTTAQGTFLAPSGIAIDSINNRIFVTNLNNQTISILNYSTPTAGSPAVITTTQGTFYSPYFIALDPNNNRIFVTNASNDNVSIINYSNPTAGSPVMITSAQGTFSSPRGIAVDTLNNRIFCVNRGYNTVSIISNNFT